MTDGKLAEQRRLCFACAKAVTSAGLERASPAAEPTPMLSGRAPGIVFIGEDAVRKSIDICSLYLLYIYTAGLGLGEYGVGH